MPPERVSSSHEYRGIKRIQQACSNCRRKKAKCSGQRPVCESCRRLSQNCQWDSTRAGRFSPEAQAHPDRTTPGSETDNSGYNDVLSTKVAAIETKLDNLINSLTTFLPIVMNNNNVNSNPSPRVMNDTGSPDETVLSSNMPAVMNVQPSSFTELPPEEVLLSLVDTYFGRVQNQPYSFFHEQSFRQRLNDGLLPDYLKFAVLASSLRFSEHPYYSNVHHEASVSYAKESWKQIVSVWFAPETDPDIYICQAITLLSIIDYTTGRRHPSWLKIGLSIRIAQDLRLMMEPDQNLSYSEQEERRRVFWSVYILDKLCSCARGRPAALDDVHCRVQLPCDEETFRTGVFKKTPTLKQLLSSPESDSEQRPSHLALVVLTASIIGRCAQYSIHEYTRSESQLPPWDSKSEFATIHSSLLQLETQFELGNGIGEALARDGLRNGEIDMQNAGPIIFSHALFHTCQCVLHHPFLLYQQCKARGIKAPQSFTNRALQTCRENACAMSQLLQDVKASGYVAAFSFVGFCTTVACSVHTMYLNNRDSSIRQQAVDYLRSDMLFLKDFSHFWEHGSQMHKIIETLCGQSLSSGSLVASPPQLEDLEQDQLENVWAAIDYGTQSEKSKTSPNDSLSNASPFGTSLLGTGPPGQSTFDHDGFLVPSTPHMTDTSPYNSMMFDGMSPLTAFFGNGSVGENFGG